MTELKLCAFCGSANVVAIEPAAGYPSSDLFKYSYVHCDDCHADGPPDLGISGAIERYNTRPVEDALRAEIATLKAELDALKNFHPRAMKLIKKRKPFLVVANDEPYYLKVYAEIRISERQKGTWTEDDQKLYINEMHKFFEREEVVGDGDK